MQDVNIEHVLFGFLENGDFKAHSDIDVMIFGDLSAQEMTIAERAISAVYQEFGVKIDYLYAMYYTEKNLHEILE
ncbi:nucleotidyltransferase domain-containing protein [Roseovarius sp. THAF8]|uniref:nucleotidyltransferase domain-containing protein n=1 Tax=Roseovarius sp. THAF8 TaxID=2587846 RepID=UPI00126876B4